jgi:hypothetical protein
MLQLGILYIQRKNPRFLLPPVLKRRLLQNYHRYERTFVEEAMVSTGTYNSDKDLFREMKDLTPKTKKEFKQELRLNRLTAEECVVCLEKLGKEPVILAREGQVGDQEDLQTFFKTKCGHRFHRKCLLDWMAEKHQCPVCRRSLPQYNSF